ncbi:MAG: hypothetical protein K8S97_00880 [Anaerolineae bacterium]|nr:hypothetical protein [Anaerolineae bacterium]
MVSLCVIGGLAQLYWISAGAQFARRGERLVFASDCDGDMEIYIMVLE